MSSEARAISDYMIGPGANFHLILCLRGGGGGPKPKEVTVETKATPDEAMDTNNQDDDEEDLETGIAASGLI
ncbi:hypothetical protein MMC25_004165 [Agyrium rufum]|nr:hypothetical protein [Agyrium rufum]